MAVESLDPLVKHWREQLEASRKREKDFRKDGKRVVSLYESEKQEENPFNVLFSNTETLLPALYNNLPRPVVERRFKDADPLGKLASRVVQRSLEFLLDSNDQDYSNFDDMAKQAVLEALLPGRGVTRFKYDATFEEMPTEVATDAAALPTEGQPQVASPAPVERVSKETVCGESVPWDRVLFGYAKQWKDMPWIAFEHFFTAAELKDNFGNEAASIPLTAQCGEEGEEGEEKKQKDAEGEKLAHVYEIWDKINRKVVFIADGYTKVVKSVEDPLKLSGFYPMPRPLGFYAKVSSLCPKALYLVYEEQAKELNLITVRIKKIVGALKVRGFYDSTLTGIEDLFKEPDNTLLPAENVSAMLQGQTLERAIWLMPIEKLINVLQQLYVQRQQVKDVIYEISGISDILRGSSAASETATAQNIKNQWGTLRLKRSQKEVQRYVRDCLRIMAEIAVTKLQPQTLAAMTGIQLPSAEEKQQAQMVMQQMQAAQQPPPPDLQQVLSTPSWQEVMGLLADDLQRNYRIDIETNSTVDIEATEDKEQIGEFMNAMAQFMNGIMPAIQSGYMSFDAAKAMLMSISRRFRFGSEVEDQISAMQAPQQGGDDPKAEADKAKFQMEMEALKAKNAGDQEMMQAEIAFKREEMALRRDELALKRQEMQQKLEFAQASHTQKMQQLAQQAALAAAQPQQGNTDANV